MRLRFGEFELTFEQTMCILIRRGMYSIAGHIKKSYIRTFWRIFIVTFPHYFGRIFLLSHVALKRSVRGYSAFQSIKNRIYIISYYPGDISSHH